MTALSNVALEKGVSGVAAALGRDRDIRINNRPPRRRAERFAVAGDDAFKITAELDVEGHKPAARFVNDLDLAQPMV